MQLSEQTIYKYQSGLYSPPIEILEKIANILEVSKDDLIKDDNVSTNPYKDALVTELKSEIKYLKQMIAYLTDGKVKDELVKLKGNFYTAVVPLNCALIEQKKAA